MERIPATLLLTVALCIVGCFCAPITTPPPPIPDPTPAPVNEGAKESDSSLADVEDVMMDPSAKLPWQKQEGDITYLTDKFLWPEDPDDPFFELPAKSRSKRAAVKNRYRLWPNGVVPYVMSDSYTENEAKVIRCAMAHWENHTCIRFVPRTNQRDYISVYPGAGCYSYVGRIGRNQGVSVGRRCFAFYTAVHELGHALGYYHEQSRPDRDDHVQIVKENMIDGAESEFEKLSEDRVDSQGVGYDYNSIMHYDATLYSRNGSPTIIALDPDIPLGRARELSALDIEQTNRLYNCPAVPPPRSTFCPEDDVEEGPTFPPQLPYPDCGGFMTDVKGTIQSPGYPRYTHNADCAWLFKMPLTGYNLIFDFEPFNVEESPGCESDYIQLYESLDTSGYTSGKRCGNHYSYFPMSSLTSYARLEFHTNGSNETPNLKGFNLNYKAVDVDECHPLWKLCSHDCRNFAGGFECSCPEGFFMSSDGLNCFDINECGLDKGGCDHKCVNKAGTYHCACEDGYTLQSDNKTCVADGAGDPCIEANCEQECEIVNNVAQCLCPQGFQLGTDRRSCVDINECLSHNGNCQHLCINNVGSYSCACNPGYDLMPDRSSCLPSDPCATNNGGCGHICTSAGGSRVCTCRSGYELASDGKSCSAIDPCAVNNGGCEHVCTTSGNSRVCSCRSGYQLSTNGTSCVFNPCAVNNGGCEHVCTISGNSRVCSCRSGYQLSTDGITCMDINECASNGGKGDCDDTCTNTPGSRVCSCPTGYQLLADGVSCEDIDECKTNNGGCGQLHCINQEGSHQCSCKEGFKLRGDGNGCAEILQGPSGKISSGNWPETYPINVDLQWVIQCESHQAVDLTFSSGFGIAGNLPSCPKDWLMVFDGDSTSSTVMGKFCHYALPQVSRSSSNTILVHFYAGPAHNSARKGFEVSYTCVDVAPRATTTAASTMKPESPSSDSLVSMSQATAPPTLPPQPTECGQTLFTESSGTIESPNYPQTYPFNIQCEYFIQLPDENSAIEISFDNGFRIAGNYPECPMDWVKVYGGHTNDDHLHGTFCQIRTPPSVIRTSGSKAKIVLYAGPIHNPSRNGFSATYRSITS